MAQSIIGRDNEQNHLRRILSSQAAEFVAVYGRRRVGKTFLIREFFSREVGDFFFFTGQKGASMKLQLHHFQQEVSRFFYGGAPLPAPLNWSDAFALMADAIEYRLKQSPRKKVVLFFDELPWMASRRSGLVSALDYIWNSRLTRLPKLKLIVCGSAASWMLSKLVHAKGGLYNRLTARIALQPFTLLETEQYLHAHGLRLKRKHVVEIYLALGGIPHYLKQLPKGTSASNVIGKLCFSHNGLLSDEYPRLFESLFDDAKAHHEIVHALHACPYGLSKKQLVEKTGIPSGGRLKSYLSQLEESGFIAQLPAFGKQKKDATFRLIDEYARFYLSWIKPAPKGLMATSGLRYWQGVRQSAAYQSWAGIAFENLCLRHLGQVVEGLELSHVLLTPSQWSYSPPKRSKQQGAQIDLVLDRNDDAITLCEIKYTDKPWVLTKQAAWEMQRKLAVFAEQTQTKKHLSLCVVSAAGLKENSWSRDLIDTRVDLKALF